MIERLKKFFVGFLLFFKRIDENGSTNGRRTFSEDEKHLFQFKRVVLDELDRYFQIIRRMKKSDPEAYKLYSKAGAALLPKHRFQLTDERLPRWWNEVRPSFGAIAFGANAEMMSYERNSVKLYPQMMYFRKWERHKYPPEIQRAGAGDVYTLTVYWDDIRDKETKTGMPSEFPVLVRPDGEIVVLRVLHRAEQKVRAKNGRDKGKTFTIPQKGWRVHPFFMEWAKEHNAGAHDYLRRIFILVASAYEQANADMTKIHVMRGSLKCVFNINILKTPYFFKDRETVLTKSGRRKPIFHIVRAHKRQLADGREVFIRTHFSGHRQFEWNGYSVRITVPGWHHADFADLNVGSMVVDDDDDLPENYMDDKEIAAWIVDAETRGRGGYEKSIKRSDRR